MLHFIITVTKHWLPLILEGLNPLLAVLVLEVLRHNQPAFFVCRLQRKLQLVVVKLLPKGYDGPWLAGDGRTGLLHLSLQVLC